jgi:hypothetical protein
VLAIAADPEGSLMVNVGKALLWRYSPDGSLHGMAPSPSGETAIAPNGVAWVSAGAAVQGYWPDGVPLVGLGTGFGQPLSLAATAGGGLLVADPRPDTMHGFLPSGSPSFSCAHPLGAEPVVAVAARDRTIVLASAGALYTATFTASSPGCRLAPLRIEGLIARGRTLHFTLTRRARLHAVLYRIGRRDCYSRWLAPSPATAGCAALGSPRRLRAWNASRGANSLALGRLEHDSRWLVTLSAGPDVAASLRFVTSQRGRAAPPARAGAAARGR